MAGEIMLINPRKRPRNMTPATRKRRLLAYARRRAARADTPQNQGYYTYSRAVAPKRKYERTKPAAKRGTYTRRLRTYSRGYRIKRVREWQRRKNFQPGSAYYYKPRRSRTRSNPIDVQDTLQGVIMPAIVGGAGAVALDVGYAALPIPATLKAGAYAPLVKGGVIVAAGEIARNFFPSRSVDMAVVTSLAIIVASFVRGQVSKMFPSLAMGMYAPDYTPSYPQLSYANAASFVPDSSVSAYVGRDMAMSGYDQGPAWGQSSYGDIVT